MRRQRARAKASANAGVSPLRRQSAPPPVEMPQLGGRKGRTGTGKGNGKSECQCGGLSTAAAECAASGRDDASWGEQRKNKQRQGQKQKQVPMRGVSPLRRPSTPPPVEMTHLGGSKGRTSNGKGISKSKCQCGGALHCGGRGRRLRSR